MNRIAPPPSSTDAVIGVLVALAIGVALYAIWWTAAGRYADPGLITIPTTTPPAFYTEEQP